MTPSQHYQAALAKPAKPRKYKNTPVVVDGLKFDSKREGSRYCELKMLARAGEISHLTVHPKFPLHVGETLIGRMEPDFSYRRDGKLVCEDVKSDPTITPIFKWKAKHLLAEYGVAVEVVK